ncbi:hypothetical protein F6X40_35625 [Paraburkholderia sp. UCT31]|uniref:hypothetical protein n=1 Tax=Paraburkholderia sp. UCT31 TaxID=2615209 RepID=UPI0016559BA9|nr:hypothetical protein [Paraburkholderia sp. UCT31]MBC8741881.1 hypothetical protein [Paraburkholderia sp. UCT31]
MSHFLTLVVGTPLERLPEVMAPYAMDAERVPQQFLVFGAVPANQAHHERALAEAASGLMPAAAIAKAPVVDWYNPKARWDAYQVGGRYRGFFRVKAGCRGVLGAKARTGGEDRPNRVDFCRFGDIDMQAMQSDRAQASKEEWEYVQFLLMQDRTTPELVEFEFGILPTDTEDSFVARQVEQILLPWAVVKDGRWHERGEMPACGIASEPKSLSDWASEVEGLLGGLSATTTIAALDCERL